MQGFTSVIKPYFIHNRIKCLKTHFTLPLKMLAHFDRSETTKKLGRRQLLSGNLSDTKKKQLEEHCATISLIGNRLVT